MGKIHTLTSIIGALIILALMAGCSDNRQAENEAEEKSIAVRGTVIYPADKELSRTFTGTLEGEQQAVIRALTSEAVEKVHRREGDMVAANKIIVSLDKTGPTSQYVQSKSLYENAEKNFNKMKYLFEQGAISETAFDGTRTEFEVARANFEAARQMVELKTPIAGMVTSVDVSVGDYVIPGQQVATVARTKTLRMKLGIGRSDIGYFDIGDRVRVYVESGDGQMAEGEVVTVAQSADPVTRTFQVEIEIDNDRRQFSPGVFARAEIVIERYDNVVVVSRQAIVDRDNKAFVFVVTGDRARAREITLGTEFNGTVHVLSGLNPGDTVVTVGQNYLSDNARIKLAAVTAADGEEK